MASTAPGPAQALTFPQAPKDTDADATLKAQLEPAVPDPGDMVGRRIRVMGRFKDNNGNVVLQPGCTGEIYGTKAGNIVEIRPHSETTKHFDVPRTALYVGLAAGREGSVSPVGRQCYLLSDFTDPTDESVQLKKNKTATLEQHSADYILATIRMSGQSQGRTFTVPGKMLALYAPKDAVGRTFSTRHRFSINKTGLQVYPGMQGRVIKVSSPLRNLVDVTFNNGETVENLSAAFCDFGAKLGEVTVRPNLPDLAPAAQIPTSAGLTPFGRHFYQLLADIARHAPQIPTLSSSHLALFNDDTGRRNFAKVAEEGVRLVSDRLVTHVFLKDQFDISDVIREARVVAHGIPPKINRQKDTPGIYLRNHDVRLAKGEETRKDYDGPGHYTYGGMTTSMSHRATTSYHGPVTKSNHKDYNTFKSWIYRNAQAVSTVQVFELPPRLHTQDQREQRILEVLETCFLLMLKLYRAKLIGAPQLGELQLEDTVAIETVFSSSHDILRTGKAFTLVAERSFAASGWSAFGRANLGIKDGLNVATPIDAAAAKFSGRVDRTIWTKSTIDIDGGKRTIFRRSHTFFGPHKPAGADSIKFMVIATVPDDQETKGTHAFLTNIDHAKDGQCGPGRDQKVWVQIEIQHSGRHPCPYLPVPAATPVDNVEEILQVGIKLHWIQRSGLMAGRYIQAPQQVLRDSYTGGPYGQMTALRAFLLHEKISPRPSWIPNYGFARVMEVQTKFFTQAVTASPIDSSQVRTRSINVVPRLAKDVIEGAGLQNYDGPHGQVPPNVHAASKSKANPRTSCDRCFLLRVTLKIASEPLCGKDSGEACTHCYQRGFRCSWTPTDVLLGDDYHLTTTEVQNRYNMLGDGPTLSPASEKKLSAIVGCMNTALVRKFIKARVMPAESKIVEYFDEDDFELEAEAEE